MNYTYNIKVNLKNELINFYETGSYENIKKWIYTNAIDGV